TQRREPRPWRACHTPAGPRALGVGAARDGREPHSVHAGPPSAGEAAVAESFLPTLPARYDSRPASSASRIARAIATGSRAPAIAVFMRTPSQPSSIAIAASDAVPTPASTMTGTDTDSRMILML